MRSWTQLKVEIKPYQGRWGWMIVREYIVGTSEFQALLYWGYARTKFGAKFAAARRLRRWSK